MGKRLKSRMKFNLEPTPVLLCFDLDPDVVGLKQTWKLNNVTGPCLPALPARHALLVDLNGFHGELVQAEWSNRVQRHPMRFVIRCY